MNELNLFKIVWQYVTVDKTIYNDYSNNIITVQNWVNGCFCQLNVSAE